jgi:hypothetical protein
VFVDPDLYFVIGIIVLLFSIPPILSAFTEGRPPRAASIMILIGGGLVGLALYQNPSGYTFETIPDVFFSVIGRYVG